MARTETNRTVVVGLDGADFALLDPWLEAGELPALEGLLADGVSGRLDSVLPPVTAPNWKAYSTGKNPGKLGIFWWWNVDTERQRIYRPSARYNATTEFWELLAEDRRVGVIGVPTTYPPKSFGSFVVSGGPDAQDTGFTHPPSLEDHLREEFDYRTSPAYHLRSETEEARREVLDVIDTTFRAARHLLESEDLSFLQVTTFHINMLHHHFWDDEVTLEGWKRIDEHLGALRDEATNVVLMSDHGMAETRTVFRINEWLKREGYLTHDAATSRALYDLGIHSDKLVDFLSRFNERVPTLDVEAVATRLAPRWVVQRIPNQDGELRASKHSRIAWAESDAIASGMGPVYLVAASGTERYERLRDELVDRLESLTDPSGNPVANAVYRAEEVYSGPYVEEGPDIVVDQARGTHIVEGMGDAEVFSSRYRHLRAMNARSGLFAAAGPAFTTGSVDALSILDLAPTLLHLEGRAVPADMDGLVRTDLFAPGSDPSGREPSVAPPTEAPTAAHSRDDGVSSDVESRLRDLGYQ